MVDKSSNILQMESSPRKKPRKQLLNSNYSKKLTDEDMEIISYTKSVIKTDENVGKLPNNIKTDTPLKKPSKEISILGDYKCSKKIKSAHFNQYEDAKSKPEKKHSILEAANDKNISKKISGWEIYELANEMKLMVEEETEMGESLKTMLGALESKMPEHGKETLKKCMEVLDSDIQRSSGTLKQVSESKTELLQLLNHKRHVKNMLDRFTNQPAEKKKGGNDINVPRSSTS